MKYSAIAFAAFALSGCGSMDRLQGQLQNRVTTTLGCDRAFVASLWGPVGITSEIDARDLAQMPCAARDRGAVLPAPVAK